MKTFYAIILAVVPVTLGAQVGCSNDAPTSGSGQQQNAQAASDAGSDVADAEDASEQVFPEETSTVEGEGVEGEEGAADTGVAADTGGAVDSGGVADSGEDAVEDTGVLF